uniref:Uncharacterized protein n=1 Tax=Pristionchus pacificus TaxID=54126 RepID=A0A2A6CAZ6_PRIPA|eukprot:PDM75392.1 hypothetical protein PRIPAC_42569 [Pristionchus pacificus]
MNPPSPPPLFDLTPFLRRANLGGLEQRRGGRETQNFVFSSPKEEKRKERGEGGRGGRPSLRWWFTIYALLCGAATVEEWRKTKNAECEPRTKREKEQKKKDAGKG